MKNVLFVDCPLILASHLQKRMGEDKVSSVLLASKKDSLPKLFSLLPDLLIIYIHKAEPTANIIDYLQAIKNNVNASRIPIVAIGLPRPKEDIVKFVKFGIRRYYVKPFKYDSFFEYISTVLQVPYFFDKSPCNVDLHLCSETLYIEVQDGINQNKVTVLGFLISEYIEFFHLKLPHVVLTLSNVDFSYIDGINIEALLDSLLDNGKVLKKNVTVITSNQFVKSLIVGHKLYSSIKVCDSLPSSFTEADKEGNDLYDLIYAKALKDTAGAFIPSISLRFTFEERIPIKGAMDIKKTIQKEIKQEPSAGSKSVAIVMADRIMLEYFSKIFKNKAFNVDTYNDGVLFLTVLKQKQYDIVILDILMKSLGGFSCIKTLFALPSPPIIFIYTQQVPKDVVLGAMQMGVRKFYTKPQLPETVLTDAIELLKV